MEKHYRKMIKDTQNRVVKSLQIQVMDQDSPRYGGFEDPAGIVQAKFSIYRVASMIACYCNKDTVYYHNSMVYERIILGLDYIRSVQHENGLFDYVTCNFYSAPDTAFCVKKLLPTYRYLDSVRAAEGLSSEEEEIYARVRAIVHDGAHGMLEGGFHTPNHRWVIASILMMCGRLFNEQELSDAALQYLNEGIDCNEDGEFAEKSAGNYNRINNDAMIMLTEATGDAYYEQQAIRNLTMMLTYWEPDGSIFTANSTRFDKDHLCYPKDYYLEYLQMGMKYGNEDFLRMANTIFELIDDKGITSPDFLIWMMLHPAYRTFEYQETYVRPDFRRMYKDSGIVRAQQGRFTYTVMSGKSNFFYLNDGAMKLEMKVAGSFCEHRAFKAESIEKTGEGEYHLSQVMRGWYYLPFKEKPSTSDWWKMDNAARDKKLGPDMHIDVWVKEQDCGVDVRVKTSGVDGAPWRIELACTGATYFASNDTEMPLDGSEVIVVKSGEAKLSAGDDTLIIGPCFGEHHFTEGKEDSELKSAGAATLYLTAYTGFDRTITIRDRRSIYESRLN